MLTTILLTAAYTSIALLAATLTLIEQRSNDCGGVLCKSLGLCACALWPLTFLVVAVAAQLQSPPQRTS